MLGPHQRKIEEVENSNELIDVLHHVVLLWEKNRMEEIIEHLKTTGYGTSDLFYRVAQAIAQTLGITSKEKKLLEGFLNSKERILKYLSRPL